MNMDLCVVASNRLGPCMGAPGATVRTSFVLLEVQVCFLFSVTSVEVPYSLKYVSYLMRRGLT